MIHFRGYTLVELMVAVGLFAVIMTLASGGYLMMIGSNRQAQGISTGINNLSFALETMTRTIRTGSKYCAVGVPCTATSFSFVDENGVTVTYSHGTQGSVGDIVKNAGTPTPLTDPSIDITSLTFYYSGITPGDPYQPYVTIIVSSSVSTGPQKTEKFTIETSAVMRGPDI